MDTQKRSTAILGTILAIILLTGVAYYLMNVSPQTTDIEENVTTTTPKETTYATSSKITISNVRANQKIESPLTITGVARGTYYFEASFPVELLDGNGKRLTIIPAQAQSDWMTENFVPFSVTLTFNKSGTATGTLIFHKDNPSGEPQYDESLEIPIRF